ncbi:P-loop containing nucleoside triphosphate hydrolase protein [Mycena maculata]|uniref:RNA helicase n=1 Tax=Mycena maculata TaxID=230809 RepID=A0AAD7IE09_9AGAR|nr:P-loop containing nucleoside triphosphate hydrolase protein [Mycena maculata]
MSLWVRSTSRRLCARDDLFALFHSSAPVSWKKRKPRFGLAEDLISSSTSGFIHVAPKEPPEKEPAPERPVKVHGRRARKIKEPPVPFTRDPLPHADVETGPESQSESHQGRNPSFRRRSAARNEQDWDRRTGKWRASKFGGGEYQGSQMGLREDRPTSYGLRYPSSGVGVHDSRDGPDRRLRDQNEYDRRPSSYPTQRSFDHRRGGGAYERESLSPGRSPHYGSSSGHVRRPSFGLRSPDAEERPSSLEGRGHGRPLDAPIPRVSPTPRSSSRADQDDGWSSLRPSRSYSENLRSTRDEDLDESASLIVSQTLKNRNQPIVPPSRPTPSTKPKLEPPPPPPPKKETSGPQLFDGPKIMLARAGVPIITKSDPATASTTSSYSPVMALKNDLPTKFTSPPLLPGLLKCLTDMLGGPTAVPTQIQALSLKWLVDPWTAGQENLPVPTGEKAALSTETADENFKEYLLASETGSGKSIAYLLPVLQALKLSEVRRASENATSIASKRGLNPRALILAPTHELARQLSGFAKALLHDVKLRVQCASRPNEPVRTPRDPTVAGKGKKNSNASRMKALLSFAEDGAMGEFQVKETDLSGSTFPVDIVVGTPMKLMEMVRGRGWERSVEFGGGVAAAREREEKGKTPEAEEDAGKEKGPKLRRGRDSVPGVGKWRSSPEMGLSEVEWVVVDEADVLFDSDFQETTRLLLADISKARGHDVPFTPLPVGLMVPTPPAPIPVPTTSRQKEKEKKAKEKEQAAQGQIVAQRSPSAITPLNYPFNLLLTSATIPNSLSSYLNAYHPALQRLVSPNLHHLPKTLKPEYVSWTGGNKNADIERRLRKVWAADAADGLGPVPDSLGDMSKVLIFCNKNTKVTDLGEFLEEKGIKNIQLSGASRNRQRGNNKHLNGFLKAVTPDVKEQLDDWSSSWVEDEEVETKRSLLPITKKSPHPTDEPINDPINVPHVMITTSLLSRGLDFSPNVKHVFIVDEPRNTIDFLHRAGRTGRAGQFGRVVIFGKTEGRGSQRSKDLRKRIKTLVA